MNAPNISSVRQVASYMQLKPLVRAVVESNDSLPKTSLPLEIPGSVQSQAKLLPPVTLYTQHGKIAKSTEPGNLIAYA
jgi:hypothetical protein